MQEYSDNKVKGQLKRVLAKKTHEMMLAEIEQMMQTQTPTSNSSEYSHYQYNPANTHQHHKSLSPQSQFIASQEYYNNKPSSPGRRSPTKIHASGSTTTNNASSPAVDKEEQIQRFEDLNRLAFFKNYQDHKKQKKMANITTATNSNFNTTSAAPLAKDEMSFLSHGTKSAEEEEQERCPPVEILSSQFEQSPLIKHKQEYVQELKANI